jgi:hypothetical protein
MTPTMAAGISDHIWNLRELLVGWGERFRVSLSIAEVRVQRAILISLTALVVVTLTANAQFKNWRNRAEYDLYSEIIKPDATPAERLQNLEKWKASYPQSDYADTRLKMYLLTYQQMNNHRAAFDTAGEILKSQPNDLLSLKEIVDHGLQLLPEQPNASLSEENKNDLNTIQKTSRYILENLDMIYGANRKPGLMSDEQWRSAKIRMQSSAQTVMNRAAALATQK